MYTLLFKHNAMDWIDLDNPNPDPNNGYDM